MRIDGWVKRFTENGAQGGDLGSAAGGYVNTA